MKWHNRLSQQKVGSVHGVVKVWRFGPVTTNANIESEPFQEEGGGRRSHCNVPNVSYGATKHVSAEPNPRQVEKLSNFKRRREPLRKAICYRPSTFSWQRFGRTRNGYQDNQ